MNIMLVSVSERTREIGLHKALGATRQDILWQFLIESVLVSVLGGLGGIVLGIAIVVAASQVAGWAILISPQSMVLALGFAGGIGIVFGLWPAYRAAELTPIQALRHE